VNLERLHIQNYKQLREPVELLPPEGAIGVVGSNGAGKSTLFESILWAFFGSRGGGPRFANESIPWSGGSTREPTVVEVELATGSGSYTVRRQLRSGSTTAETLDPGGKVVVSGAGDVTRWVEETLLGMDRTAFEATFYARQKELKFFAQDDGISRVRKVSRMLGINSVESAQQLLREDRNDLRRDAQLIENRLAEADEEALKRALEEAREECRRLEGQLEKVSAEYDTAGEELKSAREERAALDAAYRKHTRLEGSVRDAEAERRRAEDRAAEAEKDLEELASAEKEIQRLKPETEKLPGLEEELNRLEEQRRRVERREAARRELLDGQKRIAAIESRVWNLLEELDGDEEPLPGWDGLFDLEGAELLAGTTAVLEKAVEELEVAEARHEDLRELAACHEAHQLAGERVREARERHAAALAEAGAHSEELEDLSGGEDLEARERELRAEEEKLRELAANHRGRAAADEREAANVDRAREAISAGEEDHCRTCHRPFEDGERDEISDTLKRQAAAIRRRAGRETDKAKDLASAADTAGEKLAKVSGRLSRWRELKEALARAEDRAGERLETLRQEEEHRRRLEETLGGAEPPTEDEIADAHTRRECLRGLRDARPAVLSLAGDHESREERVVELTRELEELTELFYDEAAHRRKREEKASLERAQGRIEELARRLESRSRVEEALREAGEKGATAKERAEELQRELDVLGFDAASYERSGERVARAEERASELRDAREALGGEWKDADHRIERARSEIERLEADRKVANKRAAEAARMTEMDALFTEFFRSLTARIRPVLEAEASTLIRELTDGRYEQMEFDENYRVRLLDRFDDAYPIERFSGGEADVASLSARVALSRIIASRGGNDTLGFLVLDEVFGSLDAGRRNNVLLALERLKRSFGQIFIISHVAEVQESALVDEVWMLEEDEDGKSTVRRIERESSAEVLQNL
jgi:exonuclease SbcC